MFSSILIYNYRCVVTPVSTDSYHLCSRRITRKSDNRKRQSILYLKFCVAYNVHYLSPLISDLMMYVQFLKNSFASQVSVKNYVSGARTWVQLHTGDTRNFDSLELRQMFAGLDATTLHVPVPAYPLTAVDIKMICDYIDSHPELPLAIKPCILIGYTCFLRSCNLLAPSTLKWLGPHTMLASDIELNEEGLLIFLRSSKSFNAKSSKVMKVEKVKNPKYCPVMAWAFYRANVNPCPMGPAFMVTDYIPLISRNVVDVFDRALRTRLPSQAKLSMHSLCRGGTQVAANQGASNEQLLIHGTWKSTKGLKYYLPKKNNEVPNIIANSLA